MLLPDLKAKTTVKQFYLYKAMLDREFKRFHREDGYAAQVALEIRRLRSLFIAYITKEADQSHLLELKSFLLKFGEDDEEDEESLYYTEEEAAHILLCMEAQLGAVVGVNINELKRNEEARLKLEAEKAANV